MLLAEFKLWTSFYRGCFNFSNIHCLRTDYSGVHLCFPGFLNWLIILATNYFQGLFLAFLMFTYRYGGGMSSAKAALESDTQVSFCFSTNLLDPFNFF